MLGFFERLKGHAHREIQNYYLNASGFLYLVNMRKSFLIHTLLLGALLHNTVQRKRACFYNVMGMEQGGVLLQRVTNLVSNSPYCHLFVFLIVPGQVLYFILVESH